MKLLRQKKCCVLQSSFFLFDSYFSRLAFLRKDCVLFSISPSFSSFYHARCGIAEVKMASKVPRDHLLNVHTPEGKPHQDSTLLPSNLRPLVVLPCVVVHATVWMNTRVKSVALRLRRWARPGGTGTRVCHVPKAARARTHFGGHFGFCFFFALSRLSVFSFFFVYARNFARTHLLRFHQASEIGAHTFTRRESPRAIDPISSRFFDSELCDDREC